MRLPYGWAIKVTNHTDCPACQECAHRAIAHSVKGATGNTLTMDRHSATVARLPITEGWTVWTAASGPGHVTQVDPGLAMAQVAWVDGRETWEGFTYLRSIGAHHDQPTETN